MDLMIVKVVTATVVSFRYAPSRNFEISRVTLL